MFRKTARPLFRVAAFLCKLMAHMSIAERLSDIRARIDAAARRVGRKPQEVTLMAVSKTLGADAVREAYAAGQRVFGENRVQEFAEKSSELSDLANVEWHLIGHLQTNKAGKAAELFPCIDSVDSLRLGRKLNEAAEKSGTRFKVLIEINVGGEAAKSGLPPDSRELDELLQAAPQLPNLEIGGLMTIPPFTEDPEDSRSYFRKLREIRGQIAARNLPGVRMDVLSMGMSHDFEIAVEEGSTCVRVGTAIFGERMKRQ